MMAFIPKNCLVIMQLCLSVLGIFYQFPGMEEEDCLFFASIPSTVVSIFTPVVTLCLLRGSIYTFVTSVQIGAL